MGYLSAHNDNEKSQHMFTRGITFIILTGYNFVPKVTIRRLRIFFMRELSSNTHLIHAVFAHQLTLF